MALTDPHAPGATPLTVEQLKGLRNPFITTHAELNRAEQANIVAARVWARTARSIVMPKMLSRDFVESLHRRMYRDVWTWAGKQRIVDTNIGVDFPKIGVEMRILIDDARGWTTGRIRRSSTQSACTIGSLSSILSPTVTAGCRGSTLISS
jgi:fido (protein-threonine AMPylation protein)